MLWIYAVAGIVGEGARDEENQFLDVEFSISENPSALATQNTHVFTRGGLVNSMYSHFVTMGIGVFGAISSLCCRHVFSLLHMCMPLVDIVQLFNTDCVLYMGSFLSYFCWIQII